MSAEQDNFTELLERYAPFFAWLHFHHVVQFAPPGFERAPVNGKLRIYVRKKIPNSELKEDWNILYNVYLTHRDEFVNIDRQSSRIPNMIEGYPTDVVER
jgi:hypothetical protein